MFGNETRVLPGCGLLWVSGQLPLAAQEFDDGRGACVDADGFCVRMSASECEASSGLFQGDGSQCHFRRGDFNGSGLNDISDDILRLIWLFYGDAEAMCLDAADADNSGAVDVTDTLFALNLHFIGHFSFWPNPGERNCGPDPVEVLSPFAFLPEQPAITLGCEMYGDPSEPRAACP